MILEQVYEVASKLGIYTTQDRLKTIHRLSIELKLEEKDSIRRNNYLGIKDLFKKDLKNVLYFEPNIDYVDLIIDYHLENNSFDLGDKNLLNKINSDQFNDLKEKITTKAINTSLYAEDVDVNEIFKYFIKNSKPLSKDREVLMKSFFNRWEGMNGYDFKKSFHAIIISYLDDPDSPADLPKFSSLVLEGYTLKQDFNKLKKNIEDNKEDLECQLLETKLSVESNSAEIGKIINNHLKKEV
ncbi:hypothetical protein COS83_03780 [archaeon CG07_land_8_20_14_0_80_38_8]|nr:MAG: hypothetical protein COS83_03780 [archaeon CG07_land_8_20_14_0_80_38_8]PIU88298.1 MAG: hypothetical protein COS64_03940 [archaeon CG06_land_8_20_14_3_00_37_11]